MLEKFFYSNLVLRSLKLRRKTQNQTALLHGKLFRLRGNVREITHVPGVRRGLNIRLCGCRF